jgi:class 3 adenylate cyclase
LALAKSVRLRASLLEDDPTDVYQNARDVLLAPGQGALTAGPRRNANTNAPGPILRSINANFLRILDAKGQVLAPDDPRQRRPFMQARRRAYEDQLAVVGKALDKLEVQQVGYLAPQMETGRVQLLEIIVTKVIDPADAQTLGAVVLGFPLFDPGEITLKEMSEILSGIWLEGQIHSRTIAESMRAPLTRHLATEIGGTNHSEDTFVLELGDKPYRVFHKLLNPNSPFPKAYQICLYSLEDAVKTQRELRGVILGVSVVILLVGSTVLLILVNKLTLSLRELDLATAQVQRGNFQVNVPVRSRDDVGRLVSSFNEMTEGLAQKERYRRVLDLFADKSIAEEMLRGEVVLGGEARDVSVLFCDIRGFTALTQNMPPVEVIALLNEHMTALTKVVYEHDGVVDKFMGDMIMALFGAPKTYGPDMLNAARCGWNMIQARHTLNQTAAHPIQIGIGIASGQVVAGCMGSKDRVDYTVLGRRVNLASRLCSQAGPGQVLIDEATREALGEQIEVAPLPPLTLKGFDEPIPAFRLIQVRSLEASV